MDKILIKWNNIYYLCPKAKLLQVTIIINICIITYTYTKIYGIYNLYLRFKMVPKVPLK